MSTAPSFSDTNVSEYRSLPESSFLGAIWKRIGWTVATVTEIVLIFAIWEAAVTRFGWVNEVYLAPPTAIALRLGEWIQIGYLQENITFSIQNYVVGVLIAMSTGVPLGLLMGMNRLLGLLLSPFVWAFYSTPRIALYPMIVIWLGFGWESKVLLIWLSAIFPMLVNSMAGVSSVDPTLIRAGRIFGARGMIMYTKVILPATLPYVLTGMRMGVSRGLIGMVVGEMLGSSYGLGHMVSRAASVFDMTGALSATMAVVIMANVAITGFRYFEKKAVPWRVELKAFR